MFLVEVLVGPIFEIVTEDKKKLVIQIANRKPGLVKMKHKKWSYVYVLLLTFRNLKSNINYIIFHIIPDGCACQPGGKPTPKSHPRKFCKYSLFPNELDSLHRDTETGFSKRYTLLK